MVNFNEFFNDETKTMSDLELIKALCKMNVAMESIMEICNLRELQKNYNVRAFDFFYTTENGRMFRTDKAMLTDEEIMEQMKEENQCWFVTVGNECAITPLYNRDQEKYYIVEVEVSQKVTYTQNATVQVAVSYSECDGDTYRAKEIAEDKVRDADGSDFEWSDVDDWNSNKEYEDMEVESSDICEEDVAYEDVDSDVINYDDLEGDD